MPASSACSWARPAVSFPALAGEIGVLGVCLSAYGHVLARRHRKRACNEACEPGDDGCALDRAGSCHPEHETGSGDDAVVGSQNRGPQPANVVRSMVFAVRHGLRTGGARSNAGARTQRTDHDSVLMFRRREQDQLDTIRAIDIGIMAGRNLEDVAGGDARLNARLDHANYELARDAVAGVAHRA